MLWDPGSVEKDEEEGRDNAPVTPILVPLQNKPPAVEKSVPVLVPDVQDLKTQFQQQQTMLTQIKETLMQNESQLSSKGKQVELYANKLSQIRARTKNPQGKKAVGIVNPGSPKLQKKSSRENLTKPETSDVEKSSENNSKNRRGKMSELKKCLEENKIKFEQRTGKEQSETKKIETLVEQLKTQLEERDKTIQDLQKTIEQPTSKSESLPKSKAKLKESVASKSTQTMGNQPLEDSTEIIALKNKIFELETNVLDLEENLKEKESVIEARTQAVTLLSQDLSLKGKNTLDSLEETRQEMRTMQNNFVAIEDELKKSLVDRDSRLEKLEEKCKKLESTNFELSLKNAEQQEKLVNLQTKYIEVDAERKSLKESAVQGQPDDKLDELTKKISRLTKELDDRNKSMIKMKIEHKNKIKSLNQTLDTLKGTSDEKAEIVRLRSLLEEFENVKTGLENRVAELEDEKVGSPSQAKRERDLKEIQQTPDFQEGKNCAGAFAGVTEKKLKDQINELEIIIKKQNEDLALHLKTISSLEKENFELIQCNQRQNIPVETSEVMESAEKAGEESKLRELSQRLEAMEIEYNRKIEELKGEHRKEIEMVEAYYTAKGDTLDRKALEEYRISTEMNNIHVEEQIELLIREKQQLLEKLKSLSGVSSTDSLTFEKMEHSDLRDDREPTFPLGEDVQLPAQDSQINRTFHLEKIVSDQQNIINELQKRVNEEKEKVELYQQRISELEGTIKELEEVNVAFKQQIEMSEAAESGKNTKSNTNTKNRIKKIEMELTQSKKTIQEQSEKVKELNLKLQEKEELIKSYTEKIELFEKDDWDRQDQWKSEDNIEGLQELQKKCLSLENSLFELNEDCERLRKENIEVVHLLSEEKVKRRKLLEQLETKPELRDAETQNEKPDLEERIKAMSRVVEELEEKIERLETGHAVQGAADAGNKWEVKDLQEKLEWTNVVLTSKETEMFRLQNLLEDRNSAVEVLEGDLKEFKRKLAEKEKQLVEMVEELTAKDAQMKEMSGNFDKLHESVESSKQTENQMRSLFDSLKQLQEELSKKDLEVVEIRGILEQKNLEIVGLREQLEEVNSNLTYSYQQHLENMGKCLKTKESECEALLLEKNRLEEINRNLVAEKEEFYKQKMEVSDEKAKLLSDLQDKENLIVELNNKMQLLEQGKEGGKAGNKEIEDLKIKLKKLAANLKKKAQNEADLLKQMKEVEASASEKDKQVEELESKVKEVTEKWEFEKNEKDKVASELSEVVAGKVGLEKALEDFRVAHENQIVEMGSQIQSLQEACKKFEVVEQENKGKIAHLEAKTAELCELYENATSVGMQNQEIEKERQVVLEKLAETSGKYEEIKFKYEQLLLEKSEIEKKLLETQKTYEESLSEKSSLGAKIDENFAVIETLEAELKKTRDQMKIVEEKFFHSEDRRLSLENKNEEMCKKIMENSENLITIDDLSVRMDELLKSEKFLQDTVKSLESGNAELRQTLDQIQTERQSLEVELKASNEKMAEMGGELKELRSSDSEKSNSIRELTKELEKLRAENKQISVEFEKLNHDYEQFEVDFKENLENSQNVERSLRHRIEELVNENASLTERCNLLSDDKLHEAKPEEEREEKKPKKRKSVTFRTDEVEYIKDLKTQLHTYDANLKQASQEIENLKAELFRERLRHEVLDVVAEAQEKVESLRSTPEKRLPVGEMIVEKSQQAALMADSPGERKFDANAFFGNDTDDPFLEVKSVDPQQSSEFDSFMWDDGWGSEGHLEAEYLSGKVIENEKLGNEYEFRIKTLETEMKTLEEENDRLKKEVQEQAAKYAKALKKLKEVKAAHDKLLSDANKVKNNSGFGDLDAAIVDELKSQIESMEVKEKELLKNLENSKLEKESLLKKIDVLNAGNEKFLEMKERQDNEVEIWQRKNNELLREIAELRQQSQEPQILDDSALVAENRELKNKVEALEWKNCELSELLEEKQEQLEENSQRADVEKVMEEKSQLQKEIEELNNVRELLEKKLFDEEKKNTVTIGELNDQLTALATENETLQDILGEMKKSADAAKKEKKQEKQESNLFDYFKTTSPGEDAFSVVATPKQPENTQEENLKQKVADLECLLKQKEEELNTARETCKEVESFRRRLTEADNAIQAKDDQLNQLQVEKENEISCLRQSIGELENLIRLRDAENLQIKQTADQELKTLTQRIQELEGAVKVEEQFQTIDLNQTGNAAPDNEAEILRQKVIELESLLSQREEEFQRLHQTQAEEIETLRQRAFHLEDALRSREEELNGLQVARKEVEMLKQKTLELEEFARFKENEIYQVQSVKENEIQNLNQRIFDLENMLRGGTDQQKIFELENMLRFKEDEIQQKSLEMETLRKRVADLENSLSLKDQEIGCLMSRLSELEKSYNDSKLEIERLLNEEKLNVEEKFVEPFQENMKIPVAFEVEAVSRTLNEEKQKCENLQYELAEKEGLLSLKDGEIQSLNSRLVEMKAKITELQDEEASRSAEESFKAKAQLEKMVSELQEELESSNLQLSVAKRELEEFKNVRDEAVTSLKSQLFKLETEMLEFREREQMEVMQLRSELAEKTKYYEAGIKERREEEEKTKGWTRELENSKRDLQKVVEMLKSELESKEKDIDSLAQVLEEERGQLQQMQLLLGAREAEVADLKETLSNLQEEISHFRNFEKQVKELRVAQIKEAGSEVSVTPEGHPDFSDWSEHELAELSTKLQSDLDTALYMLHQRDVRCDELTFELMQLLEERDTLQLRLSTAIRANEELRALTKQDTSQNLQDSKDLVDQSNNRQGDTRVPSDDLRQLANKISELHSINYMRDKTVKDDSLQRHKEQMNLLSRVSDSDISLSRDVQSSPAVLLNWMRGKTTPKVMHI